MKRFHVFVLCMLSAATAYAAPVAWQVLAIAAASDVKSITYTRDQQGWHVSAYFCPAADPTVVSGAPALPCVHGATVDIATPSGSVLTQFKANAKSSVIAAGYPSAD